MREGVDLRRDSDDVEATLESRGCDMLKYSLLAGSFLLLNFLVDDCSPQSSSDLLGKYVRNNLRIR